MSASPTLPLLVLLLLHLLLLCILPRPDLPSRHRNRFISLMEFFFFFFLGRLPVIGCRRLCRPIFVLYLRPQSSFEIVQMLPPSSLWLRVPFRNYYLHPFDSLPRDYFSFDEEGIRGILSSRRVVEKVTVIRRTHRVWMMLVE